MNLCVDRNRGILSRFTPTILDRNTRSSFSETKARENRAATADQLSQFRLRCSLPALEFEGGCQANLLSRGRVGVHIVDDGTGVFHRLGVSIDALQLWLLLTVKHKFQNVAFDNNPGTGLRFNLYRDSLV